LALIGFFFLFAYLRMNGAIGASKSDNFLEDVRALRDSGRGSGSVDGSIHGGGKIGQGAKIEVETDHFDMGEVDNTGPTTKEILVFNRGTAPLDITEVRTNCGCTQGKLVANAKTNSGAPVTRIPPGGSLPMSVVVDPFRIPGFISTKVLTLYSNDPDTPSQEVAVTAKVKPEFILEPDTLDFGTIENGSGVEAKILLRESDAPDLDITGLRPGHNASSNSGSDAGTAGLESAKYTLDLKKRAKEDWLSPDHPEWEITVRLAPDLPAGDLNDSFVILSNIKRVDAIGYRLAAKIDSFFTVAPTMLSVRNAVDPGSDKIATAVVSSEVDFSIDELDVSGDAFTVQTRPGDQPHTFFIDLGVRPDAGPGLKNERISFTVRSGEKSVKHTMRAFASVTG
jgi:hypothetical protein